MLNEHGGALIPVFRDWLDAHNDKVGGHTPAWRLRHGQRHDPREGLAEVLTDRRARTRGAGAPRHVRRRRRAAACRNRQERAGQVGRSEGKARAEIIFSGLGLGVLTLFAASVLIFIGTEILPGDLASAILQNTATPENLAKLRLDLGLDRPAIVRYFEWLFGALHGDFGHSLANGRDVLRRSRRASPTRCSWRPTRRSSRCRSRSASGCGGDPAGRRLRPAGQCGDPDDDLGAGIFPRLSPDQICRGRSRLVSLARQRLVRTRRSSTGSTMRSCRC